MGLNLSVRVAQKVSDCLRLFHKCLKVLETKRTCYASVNSNCGAFARLVSPGGGALANLARPGGRAFANPEKFVDVFKGMFS